jgi:DNA-binding Lrp family transcriptional regulator
VDSKDFRLLVALHQDARQSFQLLGRKLLLSAPAVRERLKRLEKVGIVQGFWLTPDPGALNREDVLVFYSKSSGREDALKALKTPDVAWVALKVDGGLTIQGWPLEQHSLLGDIERALGKAPSGFTKNDKTPHTKELTLIDWQIIDALIDNPRIAIGDICKVTKLSPKTVRKHLEALVSDQFIYITPKLGALSDYGEIIYHMVIFGKASMDEIREAAPDSYLVNTSKDPPAKYLLCHAADLAEVNRVTSAVGKIPGVDSAAVTLNKEQLIATDFIRSLIREKLSDSLMP